MNHIFIYNNWFRGKWAIFQVLALGKSNRFKSFWICIPILKLKKLSENSKTRSLFIGQLEEMETVSIGLLLSFFWRILPPSHSAAFFPILNFIVKNYPWKFDQMLNLRNFSKTLPRNKLAQFWKKLTKQREKN